MYLHFIIFHMTVEFDHL